MNFLKIITILLFIFFSTYWVNWYNTEFSQKINFLWKQQLISFQKEWNQDLPKLKERIKKGEFDNIKVEKSKWERYKIPYTKPLPEFPDMEENNKTLLGIDSNNNGVRDDLEILTIERFWRDRGIVEIIFAEIRGIDYDMFLYENDLINYDSIEEVIGKGEMGSCIFWMTQRFDENMIYNKYYNTLERKKAQKAIMKGMHGHISGGINITKEFCEKGVEESKTWIYRNK